MTYSRAPSFRARTLAVAGLRGAQGTSGEMIRLLISQLEPSGIRCVDLKSSDSVLAGAALNLQAAVDPHLLAEVRRATEAEGLVFLNLDSSGRFIEVIVLDLRTGEPVLKAEGRPRGKAFATVEESAAIAAEALGVLSQNRRKATVRASDSTDEIPVP